MKILFKKKSGRIIKTLHYMIHINKKIITTLTMRLNLNRKAIKHSSMNQNHRSESTKTSRTISTAKLQHID